ncbi:MAG TPA: ABC transporter ATP-binding protein [Acidimicrobiales bacterium]|nr:ABC transporter ATP-binding protein [Acidimicrobiales bacterium]
MAALLEVEDLRAGYGELPVLQGVTFSVQEGSTCVLLGLNGAGKTTTVSNLVGLYKPWGGAVRFDGEDVTGHSPADLVKRGIVMVPEGRRTFPQLTVVQNLRLGAWVRRKDKEGVDATMERVFEYFPRLEERRDQLAGSMSGGEQQMLAIGRGMMADPRLLVIDEASLGLSPLLAKTVFQVVDRIKDDGVTVILVEQNVGALRHADQALVMEKGELVYQGHGDEIRDSSRLRETYLGAPA